MDNFTRLKSLFFKICFFLFASFVSAFIGFNFGYKASQEDINNVRRLRIIEREVGELVKEKERQDEVKRLAPKRDELAKYLYNINQVYSIDILELTHSRCRVRVLINYTQGPQAKNIGNKVCKDALEWLYKNGFEGIVGINSGGVSCGVSNPPVENTMYGITTYRVTNFNKGLPPQDIMTWSVNISPIEKALH